MQNRWSSLSSLLLYCVVFGYSGRSCSKKNKIKNSDKKPSRFQVKFLLMKCYCLKKKKSNFLWTFVWTVMSCKATTTVIDKERGLTRQMPHLDPHVCPLLSSFFLICLSFHSERVNSNAVWRLTVTCWLTWTAAMACRLLELLLPPPPDSDGKNCKFMYRSVIARHKRHKERGRDKRTTV